MWVTSPWSQKIFAFTLATKQRDPDRDFGTVSGFGHTLPWAMWSDGTTMWVSGGPHDKLWAYNMPGNATWRSDLSAGTLNPAFDSGVWSYTVPVASSVSQVTVTAKKPMRATPRYGNDAEISGRRPRRRPAVDLRWATTRSRSKSPPRTSTPASTR